MNIGESKKAVANRQPPPSYGHVSFTRTAAASTPTAATSRDSPAPMADADADADARRRRCGPLNQSVHLIRLASGLPPDWGYTRVLRRRRA